MPTLPLIQIPKTKSEDEFESICADFLKDYYKKPFTRYGRKGQKQYGIDIYCDTNNGKQIVAQCKNYLSLKSNELIQQIKNDIKSADAKFKIDTFIIMTALDRDTAVQDCVSTFKSKYSFSIELFFWEDIQLKIVEDSNLINKYYSSLLPSTNPEKEMLVTLLTESRGKCLNCGNSLGIPVRGKLPSARCEIVHITFSDTESKGYENAVALCKGTCAKEAAVMSDDAKNVLLENKRRCAEIQAFIEKTESIKFPKQIENVLREIHKVKNLGGLQKTDLNDLVEIEQKIHERYLKDKIDVSMVRFYKTVKSICSRLEQEIGFDTQVFGEMMKSAQILLSSGLKDKPEITDPQEFVTELLVDKLCSQVGQQHKGACDIIVGYLVKRCDLFNENAKQG